MFFSRRFAGASIIALALSAQAGLAQWDWTTNVPHMFNTNTGNVGISQNNPLDMLHLTYTPLKSPGEATVRLSAQNEGYIGKFTLNNLGGQSSFATNDDVILKSQGNKADDVIITANTATGDIRFGTGVPDTEKMTILNNGNVGIGYITPSVKLRVEGAAQVLGSNSSTKALPWWTSMTSGLFSVADSDGGGLFAWDSAGIADDRADMVLWYGDDWNANMRFMRSAWNGTNMALYDVMSMSPLLNVGIATTAPQARFHVQDGTVLFKGSGITDPLTGLPTGNTPVSGAGTRLMWIPARKAFRAGEVSGTQWDDTNIGDYSFAFGRDSRAEDNYTVAMGYGAKAIGEHSIALGWNADANSGFVTPGEHGAIAIGHDSKAYAQDAVAIGYSARAQGVYSYALGHGAFSSATESIALGGGASASANYALALGNVAYATGTDAVAIGSSSSSSGANAFAIGSGATATNTHSFAMGRMMQNNTPSSLMVGFSSTLTTTPRLYVDATHVAVNTSTPGGYDFYVNGTTYCSLGIWSASDERFKKDIKPIENASSQLMKLQGVTYNWKEKEFPEREFPSDKQIGLIAQEVEKVFPELVKTNTDGYKAIAYQNLVPVLVEAFKEQQTSVKNLQENNDKLANELSEVRAENEQLQSKMTMLMDRLDRLDATLQQCCAQNSFDRTGTIDSPAFDGAVLEQNDPNPFDGTTTIRYQLPNQSNHAEIVISSIETGSKLTVFTLKNNSGSVVVNAQNWASGTYLYSLIIDGKIVVSKKMSLIR